MAAMNEKRVTIVDYGAGNLRSVARAVGKLGYEPLVSSQPEDVAGARWLILPGVGAAADAMASLKALGLVEPLRQAIEQDKPFFGVCLGLQLLFTATEEGGGHPCLDVVPGQIRRLAARGLKVPHMGWNQVHHRRPPALFHGIPPSQKHTPELH